MLDRRCRVAIVGIVIAIVLVVATHGRLVGLSLSGAQSSDRHHRLSRYYSTRNGELEFPMLVRFMLLVSHLSCFVWFVFISNNPDAVIACAQRTYCDFLVAVMTISCYKIEPARPDREVKTNCTPLALRY